MNLTTVLPQAPPTMTSIRVPWWTKGDLNAFFGLAFNILVNVLTLTGLLIFVVQMPPQTVLGTVLPALGIALIVGKSTTRSWPAGWPAGRAGTDVAAMPYGPSVPHMFIVVFVIMLPIFLRTGDPVQAWQAGLAWAFIIGVIVLIGAFIGPVHPQDHAARGAARHAGRHLDQLHLDAPRRPDLGGGLDRAAGARHHPGRLLHRPEAARRHAGRPGRAAGRHRHRLDRRLHVGAGRRRGGQRHRHRGAVAQRRAADQGPGRHGSAAGDGDPARGLQLPRGDEQRGERRPRPATATTCAACCWPTAPARSSGSALGSPFPPAVYIGHPGGRRPAGGPATRWPAACSSRCCASSACSGCSPRCCRCRRSCRSCSTSAC